MTKFDYDHLCDLLYTTLPDNFKKELNRLGLPETRLGSLLKRFESEQRQRMKEIEIEQHNLLEDKEEASARLAAVSKLLS